MLSKKGLLLLSSLFFIQHIFAQNTFTQTDISQFYRNGLELWDKQKYTSSQKQFEQYVAQVTPQDLKAIEAHYYIAIAALYTENPDADIKVKNFINNYPDHPKAVLAYYEMGSYYYQKKDFKKTIEYLEKVETDRISADKRVEAQFKLAYAYFSVKNYDKALPLFSILKKYNNTYTSASNYYAGYIYFQREQYEQALTDLNKAKTDKTYEANANYLITYIYYNQKKYNEVIAFGESLKGTIPADISLMVGDAYYQKKQYKQATEWFEKYQKAKGGKLEGEIAYRVAHAYYEIQQYPQAIQGFKEVAAASTPNNLSPIAQNATYYLGLSYLKTENKPFALNAFEQSRKATHYPDIARESDFYYGKIAFDLGRYNDALEALKLYVKEYPNTKQAQEANELITNAYLNNNNYAEAITYIESLPNRNTTINSAYQKLTFAKASQDYNNAQYESAVKFFQKSAITGTDKTLEAKAWYYIGEAFSIGKRYEEAVQNYQKALAFQGETYAATLYAMAYAQYNQKNYKEAQQFFEKFIATRPDDKTKLADAYIRLADCNYTTKAYDNALANYDKALAVPTKDEDYVLYQKGVIWGIQNKSQQAEASLKQVIAKHKDSPYYDDALFQIAQLDLQNNRTQQAVQGFTQLIEEKPQSNAIPYALLRRAVAYNSLGEKDKAIDDYKRIVKDYTKSKAASNALYGLQALLGEQGKDDEFQAILATYKAANPSDNTLENVEYDSAKNLYFAQNYGKAIQALQLFLQEHPKSELAYDAKYYLAEAYFRSNDEDKALQYHEEVIAEKKSGSYTRSLQRAADILQKRKETKKVVTYYRLLAASAVNKREEATAWTGLMEGYFTLQQYDSTLYFAGEILEKNNNNTANYRAMLYKGKVAYVQGNLDKALNEFLSTRNVAKDASGAEAQYLLADVLYKQKQHKQSIEALFELNDKYRNYDYWRGQSYLLIADNYVALDEIFQAKATLNSIIENAQDPQLVQQAKERLNKIKK